MTAHQHIDPWVAIAKNGGYTREFLGRTAAEKRARIEAENARRAEAERVAKAKALRDRAIPIWARQIIDEVCATHRVPFDAVMFRGLDHKTVTTRGEAVYRIKALRPALSSPQIGRWFGIHHTTVLHALSSHAARHGLPILSTYNAELVRERNRLARRAGK